MAESPRRRSRYTDSPSPRRTSRGRTRSRTPPRRDVGHSREEALNPGNNLYVTGLSTRVTEKDLEEHFSKEGKVTECRLVVDPRTRESRGFGFVTMENPDDADRTVKYLNRTTLEGRVITVEKVSSNLSKSAGELNFSH
jgi:transformer-2 protein